MKLAPLFMLVACAMFGMAQEPNSDPFAFESGPPKKAKYLVHCANGHKDLKNVEILYGHAGGLLTNLETKAKVEKGEAVLGGCVVDSRKHWVVCKTCGLRYDDESSAWRDERSIPSDDLKLLRSPVLLKFPIQAPVSAEANIAYIRWFSGSRLVGESASFSNHADAEEIHSALQKWLPGSVSFKPPENDGSGSATKSFQWKADGKSIQLDYSIDFKTEPIERRFTFAWHMEGKKR